MSASKSIVIPSRVKDRSGQIYGRLTVLSFAGCKYGEAFWLCRCDCGFDTLVLGSSLQTGHTKSCGCKRRECGATINKRHGMWNTPIYHCWSDMKCRCVNCDHIDYPDYGGRGICVCSKWLESFEAFLADMGPRPSSKHSLDRIDNEGNYEPANCRWATQIQQHRNCRRNHQLTFQGKTQCLVEWAEEMGINRLTLSARLLSYGWSVERALTEPVHYEKGHALNAEVMR